MSRSLIQKYLNELSDLRRLSGSRRESVVREAFKDLLKGLGRAHKLLAEAPLEKDDLPPRDAVPLRTGRF